ncbi:MAG TPA: hypothetical protein VG125_05940 [Pirellulales bacterium]|jgi:hypothetical protein|nr:hypothetical protein [Pirellulales bacterium]
MIAASASPFFRLPDGVLPVPFVLMRFNIVRHRAMRSPTSPIRLSSASLSEFRVSSVFSRSLISRPIDSQFGSRHDLEYSLEYFAAYFTGGCAVWLFDYWPDGQLGEEAVRAMMQPYRSILCDCTHGGWADWQNEVTESGRSRLSPTTRAGVVHNFTIARLKLALSANLNIQICERLGFFKFYVSNGDDLAVVRFKRLGRDRCARNVRTKQQKKWYALATIDGIREEATRVTVGYMLDLSQTKIEDILVTLQFRKDVLWYFSIDDGTAQIMQRPVAPAPGQRGPIVRPADGREPGKAKEA